MSKESKRRVVKVPTEELRTIPDLVPRRDDTFINLVQAAVRGEVPVYLAAVPLAFCVPFDLDYRPDLHPVGAAAIRSVMEEPELRAAMIAYPRGKWFIISDDYIRLFAALRRPADSVMCWILGEPDNDLVGVVQGPLALAEVPRALGLE
jgi:hypothetical protein